MKCSAAHHMLAENEKIAVYRKREEEGAREGVLEIRHASRRDKQHKQAKLCFVNEHFPRRERNRYVELQYIVQSYSPQMR